MIRVIFSLFLGAILFASSAASAQTATRSIVRVGDVTGIDMALEGDLLVFRGGRWRARATIYEVVGVRDLRPARRATVRLLISGRNPTPVDLTTDDRGQLFIDIPVPPDAPDVISVTLDARHRNVIRRRFDLTLQVGDDQQLLWVPVPALAIGARVPVIGGLISRTTQKPLADRAFIVQATDEHGAVIAEHRLRTDAHGMVAQMLPLTAQAPMQLTVLTQIGDRVVTLSHENVAVVLPAPDALNARIQLSSQRVQAGQSIDVDVVARTGEGFPVANAVVRLVGEQDERSVRTDARGRARLTWRLNSSATPMRDELVQVLVESEAYGSTTAAERIRVVGRDWQAFAFAQGGALSANVSNELFVVVADAFGMPHANKRLKITAPELGARGIRVVTDASGAARTAVGQWRPDASVLESLADEPCIAGSTPVIIEDEDDANTRDSVCIEVNPDQTLLVRPSAAHVAPGGTIDFSITRALSVAHAPVLVTLWSGKSVLGMTVLDADAIAGHVAVPNDFARGYLFDAAVSLDLVARPLVGASQQEILGGSASVWAFPSRVQAAQDAQHDVRMAFDRTDALNEWLQLTRARMSGRFASLLRDTDRSEAFTAAFLASITPADEGAPAIFVDGRVVDRPAPEDSELTRNFLRDPWRSRARFVEGRLGTLFRHIEGAVESSLPLQLDRITVRTPRGREFSELLLEALPGADDTGESSRALSGEPITFSMLRSLDPEFDFNHVARRITRKRLFSLTLALRDFVRAHHFDLPWSVTGDPAEWLSHLPENAGQGELVSISPAQLVDAWGRAFVLRRVTRPRYSGLVPVQGYELLSAGPDGVAGNADDVVDPTAPILSSTGAYGRAVGEGVLIARLRSVEFGRAIIEALSPSDVEPVFDSAPENRRGLSLIDVLAQAGQPFVRPAVLPMHKPQTDDFALTHGSSTRSQDAIAARMVGEVSLRSTTDALPTVSVRASVQGENVFVIYTPPSRLAAGEPLVVRATVLPLDDQPHSISIEAVGARGVAVQAPPSLSLQNGLHASLPLSLSRSTPGDGDVRLTLREADRVLHRSHHALGEADALLGLRADAVGGPGASSWNVNVDLPAGARDVQSRLVLVRADALAHDPDFHEARRAAPALFAWSDAMGARPLTTRTRTQLVRFANTSALRSEQSTSLELASAIIALSSADPSDTEASRARTSALYALIRRGVSDDARMERAALLALLAPIAAGTSSDQLESFANENKGQLRAMLMGSVHVAAIDALGAAALLLVDSHDGYARAAFERVRDAWRSDDIDFGLDANMVHRQEIERAALFAMTIAAHQYGDNAVRDRFARLALSRITSPRALGGTALAWYLAAGAYGAFGSPSAHAHVAFAGTSRNVATHDAVTQVALTNVPSSVHVDDYTGLIARVESHYRAPYVDVAAAGVTLALSGEPGDVNGVAAYELSLTANRTLSNLVLELQLPANADAADAMDRLSSLGYIQLMQPDSLRDHGVIRMTVSAMSPGQIVRIPLSWRWRALGQVRGVGVVAFEALSPDRRSSIAPRVIDVR